MSAKDRMPAWSRRPSRSVLFGLALMLVVALVVIPRLLDSGSEQPGGQAVLPKSGGVPSTLAGPPPTTGYPGESSTGVRDGIRLEDYAGPCTIREDNTHIEGATVRCKLFVMARNVVILDSVVRGTVEVVGQESSLTIEDSEIDGGNAYEPTVGSENVTMRRTEVTGGQHSVLCHTNCIIEDSWLHGQFLPPDEAWHLNAFLSNGGSNVILYHNTLACDAEPNPVDGGCTANASIFGDFAPNSYYTFDSNLFVASSYMSYCAYAGLDPAKEFGTMVDHIVFTNNVFQHGDNGQCGQYGPATSFDPSASGNVWTNNVWDDGLLINPP